MRTAWLIVLSIVALGVGIQQCRGQLDSLTLNKISKELLEYDNLKIKYQNLQEQQVLLQEKVTNLSEYNAQIHKTNDKLRIENKKFEAYRKKYRNVKYVASAIPVASAIIADLATPDKNNSGLIWAGIGVGITLQIIL